MLSLRQQKHPWPSGQIFYSPGGHFSYQVIGPCCRLFDREELPWPCCRLDWHGKEPSWRRVGKRFTADMATRKYPSYCVKVLDGRRARDELVITLYLVKLSEAEQDWWYSKKLPVVGAAVKEGFKAQGRS